MKASEIQIGDWVIVNDIEHTHPLQIAEIFKKCGAYYATLYWDGMPDNSIPDTLSADIDKIEPVHLTPEVFEKNGFKSPMPNGMMLFGDKEKDISIVVMKTNNAPNCNGEYLVGIKQSYTDSKVVMNYVHQLQHHLRLCGIKKEIEL